MPEIWNKYAPTAAQSHDSSRSDSRRPQSGTLDIHSHVMVPAAADLVKPHLPPADTSAASETIAVGRKQEADRRSRLIELNERLADLDSMGIAVQTIKPTPMQCYYNVPPEIAVKAARMINDGLAEFAARRPDRFVALGTVPLPDAHAAAAELERCMRELSFKGVQILTNVSGREISDRGSILLGQSRGAARAGGDPSARLHRAAKVRAVLFQQRHRQSARHDRCGHHLIFDGVLERFPNLRILAVHGGAFAAAYSGRMDHAWGARSDSHGTLPKPPTFYLRKLYFDTVVFTPHQLENLVAVFGPDHIVMGTDYPYDMGEYDPIGHVLSVERFDAKTVAALAGGNARHLLGLGLA